MPVPADFKRCSGGHKWELKSQCPRSTFGMLLSSEPYQKPRGGSDIFVSNLICKLSYFDVAGNVLSCWHCTCYSFVPTGAAVNRLDRGEVWRRTRAGLCRHTIIFFSNEALLMRVSEWLTGHHWQARTQERGPLPLSYDLVLTLSQWHTMY